MAAEFSFDSFLDLLQQSGLVSDSQMVALRAEFGDKNARPENARALADELVKRDILTDWQADMLMQGKHRGFRLGPHKILRPLGQGGMSKVFLAEHEMMRRRCAIKVLPTKYQEDPDLLSRFHLEARAIAALDHPHIVRAYDFNKDIRYGKEIHYLVMEYVEGQDLRRMVDEQGPLDYRKAADFICQAAEGLAHAHAAGFVHRDVKPANLLVDPNGVLKILDLGLARFTFEGEDAWQTPEGEQSAVGTADYVAPEQVMDSRSVDGRADIYSLGYTFYFLLTGRRPFPKSTLVELLMAHRVETPEPIGKLRPDVPPELVEIIDRMTAKTPELRFQTAKEVAEKLQAWMHDSESGREYSRISALMAAAMRAKQPGSESTPTKPESAGKAELELKLLDDEQANPTPLKMSDSRRMDTVRALADAKHNKENPRKLAPGESGKTAALPRARADLLLELIPDQDKFLPVAPPQFKHHGAANSPWKSPWLWIALVGVVVIVLLVLAILLTPSSGSRKADQLSRREHAEENSAHSAIPPLSERTSQPTPDQSHTESPAPKPIAESPQKEAPKVALPSVKATPPSPPAEKPAAEATPPTKEAPAKATEEHPTPQPPAKPPAENPAPASLLVNLTPNSPICFRFHSSDPDPKSTLNLTVARQAFEAAKQVRLTPVENAPFAMFVEVNAATTADSFSVSLNAELKYHDASGAEVTCWSQSKQIVSLGRVRPEQAIKVLRLGASKFFDQFADQVRRARSKPTLK